MNTQVSLSAAGPSSLVPLNYLQNPFSVALQTFAAAGGFTGTYSVEHTLDSLANRQQVKSLVRAGTTVTVVTYNAHGLRTGDAAIIENSGVAACDGTQAVTVVDSVTFTYTSTVSGAATGGQQNGSPIAIPLRFAAHATLVAKTAPDQGNYQFPVTACRLNVTAFTSGQLFLAVNQGAQT